MKECGHYQESSQHAENVHHTNQAMGYHNMADRANVAKTIQEMQGAKVRSQDMGKPEDGSGGSKGKDY